MNPAVECEARYERAYDQQTASTLIVFQPGGVQTLACAFDRPLLVAMCRQVIEDRA